ncbi:MAG: acyltransferase family protein [Ilumatobacteraceae bacterium]
MTDWSPPPAQKGQISRVPHLPGLDGLRALAVVAVMLYHARSSWLHGGFLGVEVFFVISGYLITLLLIGEHERTGTVDLRSFWIRRFRRLLPAMYVMLALLMVYLAVFMRQAQGRVRGDILAGVLYVSNWYQIWVGAGYTANEAFAPLRHLWSLAVEEQFYFIWPLVMVVILRRGQASLPRMALWLFGVSVTITLVMAILFVPGDINSTCSAENSYGYWRIFGRCISVNDTLYLSTITRAGGLMLGAAFAMVWRPVAIMRSPMRSKGRQLDVLAIVGIVVLGFLMWNVHLADPAESSLTGSQFDPWLFRGGLFVAGLATLMVIAAVTHQRALAGVVLGNPVFSWVGTRSYGLYLYHWPIYQIIRKEAGIPLTFWQFVLAMIITVPLTEASYRMVEMPIRRGAIGAWLKSDRRRASSATLMHRRRLVGLMVVATALVGCAGVSIAMAPNECVGQVECSLADGEQATATTDATTVPGTEAPITVVETVDPNTSTIPGETVVTTPPTEPPTTPAPTTTLPVAERPPLAFGESVMKGAVPQLQAGGFTPIAEESKQGSWIAETIGMMRAGGQIGQVVVIQTGTNGPVFDETFDQIMSFLPANEVPQVVFLTVHADRNYIDDNNTRIWNLPGRYPNVTVLDWDGLVKQGVVPGMCRDGVHLCEKSAKQFYANYIFGVIGRNDLIQPLPE